MKKAVTLLLALMICACCFHACSGESLPTEDLPVAGLKFTYPAAFVDAKGVVGTDGAMKLGDRILYAYWYYFGVTPEEFETLLAQDPDALSGRGAVMFYVFSVGNGKDFSAVSSLIGNAFTPEDAIRIGRRRTGPSTCARRRIRTSPPRRIRNTRRSTRRCAPWSRKSRKGLRCPFLFRMMPGTTIT